MNRLSRLAIIGLSIGLVGCAGGSGPSATVSASGSASASSSASPVPSTPSVAPSGSAEASQAGSPDLATAPIFQNWALATIRVNGLNVREARSTQAPILTDQGGLYGATGKVQLATGDHVLVISSATWADGHWWLEIPTDRVGYGGVQVGYVAAGTRSDPWVAEDNSWCPGEGPSFTDLVPLSGIERSSCYSSGPLTIQAYRTTIAPGAGLGGACDPAASLPRWLVCDNINYNWVNRDGGFATELVLHFDPATGIPPTGLAAEGAPNPPMTITGHFDDPASVECAPNPPTTLEETAAYFACTTLFVVEKIS